MLEINSNYDVNNQNEFAENYVILNKSLKSIDEKIKKFKDVVLEDISQISEDELIKGFYSLNEDNVSDANFGLEGNAVLYVRKTNGKYLKNLNKLKELNPELVAYKERINTISEMLKDPVIGDDFKRHLTYQGYKFAVSRTKKLKENSKINSKIEELVESAGENLVGLINAKESIKKELSKMEKSVVDPFEADGILKISTAEINASELSILKMPQELLLKYKDSIYGSIVDESETVKRLENSKDIDIDEYVTYSSNLRYLSEMKEDVGFSDYMTAANSYFETLVMKGQEAATKFKELTFKDLNLK